MVKRLNLPHIEKVHEESYGPWPDNGHVCLTCWQKWPCHASLLLAELRAEHKRFGLLYEGLRTYVECVEDAQAPTVGPSLDVLIVMEAACVAMDVAGTAYKKVQK